MIVTLILFFIIILLLDNKEKPTNIWKYIYLTQIDIFNYPQNHNGNDIKTILLKY